MNMETPIPDWDEILREFYTTLIRVSYGGCGNSPPTFPKKLESYDVTITSATIGYTTQQSTEAWCITAEFDVSCS